MHPHRLQTIDDVRRFALAGNATLTLVSLKTGTRFTFRIRKPDETTPYFVNVLNGPDNESDYAYLGIIGKDDQQFRITAKSRISHDAPCAKAFRWFWAAVQALMIPEQLEVWHEGRCGRCGRKLTVPSSIESGIGPICEGM